MMPEVPTDEAVTDPIVASEEEPRDSEVDPESPPGMIFSFVFFLFLFFFLTPLADIYIYILPADLPEDSDDFEPSMDTTFDDVSDELMEAESIPPVVEEGTL